MEWNGDAAAMRRYRRDVVYERWRERFGAGTIGRLVCSRGVGRPVGFEE